MRLHVYLAKCGVASRRGAERIIQAGRVSVNGKLIHQLVYIVSPHDQVAVDGNAINYSPLFYYALNKPTHYICSNYDQYDRPLAIDLISNPTHTHLFTAGRLDWLSSGLIFVTNDGGFSRKITLPSSRVEREYVVESTLPIPKKALESYYAPQIINGVAYRVQNLIWNSPYQVAIVLTEGRNREIRNIMAAIGVPIIRLHRVRIGSIKIGNLKYGEYRTLSPKEINTFSSEERNDNSH